MGGPLPSNPPARGAYNCALCSVDILFASSILRGPLPVLTVSWRLLGVADRLDDKGGNIRDMLAKGKSIAAAKTATLKKLKSRAAKKKRKETMNLANQLTAEEEDPEQMQKKGRRSRAYLMRGDLEKVLAYRDYMVSPGLWLSVFVSCSSTSARSRRCRFFSRAC